VTSKSCLDKNFRSFYDALKNLAERSQSDKIVLKYKKKEKKLIFRRIIHCYCKILDKLQRA